MDLIHWVAIHWVARNHDTSKIGGGFGGSALCGKRLHRSRARYRRHPSFSGDRRERRRHVAGYRWHRAGRRWRVAGCRQQHSTDANAWRRPNLESSEYARRWASEQWASGRQASERHVPSPHPRGHQGGNRGRSRLPTMPRQRQIFERATDVPWSSGISLLSTVPSTETALEGPGREAPRQSAAERAISDSGFGPRSGLATRPLDEWRRRRARLQQRHRPLMPYLLPWQPNSTVSAEMRAMFTVTGQVERSRKRKDDHDRSGIRSRKL
jgi:hypothetical protein